MDISPASFPSTHWSVVLAAGEDSNPAAREALEQLCRAYWYPLYAYARRRGYSPEDAADLTQGFFEKLLERDLLAGLRQAGARFRSFLLQAMKNFMASEWNRSRAAKRGGSHTILSWDELNAEARFLQEPADIETPETVYERRWANTLMQKTLDQLRVEQIAAGKIAAFEELSTSLTGASQPYAQIAFKLGITEAAVKMDVHRLRKRYGELLRLEVAQTVATVAEIDEELRHLLSVVARR